MKAHISHYAILILILIIGAASFLGLQGNHPGQLAIGIVTTVAYVSWGIIHHAMEHDIHPKVVVEYALIGAMALLLLMVVLGS